MKNFLNNPGILIVKIAIFLRKIFWQKIEIQASRKTDLKFTFFENYIKYFYKGSFCMYIILIDFLRKEHLKMS